MTIIGDLNAKHKNWNKGNTNPRGQWLQDYCSKHDLWIANTDYAHLVPTFDRGTGLMHQQSTLDLVITRYRTKDNLVDMKVLNNSNLPSDHDPVSAVWEDQSGGWIKEPVVEEVKWRISQHTVPERWEQYTKTV